MRKFLIFSYVVLLSSIVYFIYSSYQLHIESKNQQAAAPVIGTWESNSTFQASPLYDSAPELDWDISEQPSESQALADEDIEIPFDTAGVEELETQPSQAQNDPELDPELETLFRALKNLYDQREVIYREIGPLSAELRELKYRQIDIGLYDLVGANSEETEDLHNEFDRSQDRMQELRAIIAPLEEQKLGLEKEMKQAISAYGMDVREFYERYDDAYESWESGL